jgi:DnaJ-class molecular chaperone
MKLIECFECDNYYNNRRVKGETKYCHACKGKGYVAVFEQIGCPECRGAGWVDIGTTDNLMGMCFHKDCIVCNGKGFVDERELIEEKLKEWEEENKQFEQELERQEGK